MADSPLIKVIVIAIFVMILASLATAAFNLFRRDRCQESTATVKALTVRVALSFALVIVLGVLYALGIIEPNG
ncbi:MAG: DUF2909 domain-containing protein [Gammaproteobacteria bacterium]